MKTMIIGFAMFIVVVSVATMCNTNRALEQTKAINDTKEACLKNELLNNELSDDCKIIIREARGE